MEVLKFNNVNSSISQRFKMTKKMSSTELSTFQFVKTEEILDLAVYYKFINWVRVEFDLYLMNDEQGLKVYFPSGWFSVRSFNDNTSVNLEIKVEGKSKIICGKITDKLLNVYNRVSYCFE